MSAVFGSSSSLPPLVSEGGGLVCESVVKADPLLVQQEVQGSVDVPLTCHPSSSLTTCAFRSSESWTHMVALTQWVMFPICLKRTADVITPVLVQCFGGLFVWLVSRLGGDKNCHSNSKRSTVLYCQLMTDLHNISIV